VASWNVNRTRINAGSSIAADAGFPESMTKTYLPFLGGGVCDANLSLYLVECFDAAAPFYTAVKENNQRDNV
jgi:hypothetical protein